MPGLVTAAGMWFRISGFLLVVGGSGMAAKPLGEFPLSFEERNGSYFRGATDIRF